MSQRTSIDWSPPIETGLTENPYPNVEMNPYIDCIEEAHQAGVYVLELSIPSSNSDELYHRLWLESHDTVHPELESIIQAERLLYVGEANDVLSRLEEHLDNPNRSSTLTATFPIHSIVDIDFYESKVIAEENEKSKRDELLKKNPTYHVHTR